MNINNVINSIQSLRNQIKVIELESPSNLEVKTNSEQPDLIIINGIPTLEAFNNAKENICHGGFILIGRGNARLTKNKKQIDDLYGEMPKIAIEVAKNNEFGCTLYNTYLYVKGLQLESEVNDKKDYFEYKTNKTIAPNLMLHNIKARLKNLPTEQVINIETKPEVKRKRRTKAEIEADKNKEAL